MKWVDSLWLKSGFFRKILRAVRQWRYPGVAQYWEQRYASGGHSGAGSTGLVGQFKADFLNAFVQENQIETIIELGCGDGQQLGLAKYPAYKGLDIAPAAIAICQHRFSGDPTKSFAVYVPESYDPNLYLAPLVLSLEVIFHLTEPSIYQNYIKHLFATSTQWVLVFDSNIEDVSGGIYPHYKPRIWVADVPQGWILRKSVICPHQSVMPSYFWVFERET